MRHRVEITHSYLQHRSDFNTPPNASEVVRSSEVDEKLLRTVVAGVLAPLSERESLVLDALCGLTENEHQTQRAVAKLIERSPRTVRRVRDRALDKLRNGFKNNTALEDLLQN